MSVVTKGIGLAKKIKHRYEDKKKENTPVFLSPVRRIERVKLPQRVCAMTFDDGPCRLPAQPGGDRPLTLALVEALEQYEGKGTFDVVGDTSGNYPDQPGKHGSASWGGVRFDHYPDINKDDQGGSVHCPELIARILSGGHEITSHTYAHVLYGWKPLVYGRRSYLGDMEQVLADLRRLHALLREEYGYEITLSRPPHYVDQIQKKRRTALPAGAVTLTAYDAYAQMGYQYLAASFDGAGWLPLSSYAQEVEVTWKPMERALTEDPDALCGQIIFQKDGYNMARRSPVADGLPLQLALLKKRGYRVITVSELLALSPFRDVGPGEPGFAVAKKLLDNGFCPVFRDNTLRLSQPVTLAELAMITFGWQAVHAPKPLALSKEFPKEIPAGHPYAGGLALALEANCFPKGLSKSCLTDPLTGPQLASFSQARFGKSPHLVPLAPTRLQVLESLAEY